MVLLPMTGYAEELRGSATAASAARKRSQKACYCGLIARGFGTLSDIVSAEAWYEAVTSLADRAEDIANPTATYVDTAFLATLQNKRSQIIFGRRGTGKTHLLRRLQDELLSRFSELRIVPVYIDGATLEGSISLYNDRAAIALGLYVELLRRAVRELSLFVDHELRPTGKLDWLFSGSRRDQLSQVREAVSRLDRLLTQGKVRMLPMGQASAEFEDLDEAVTSRRLAAGVNATATLSDPRSLGIKLEASAEKDLKKSVKKMITRKIGGETYLPFAEITELIRRLLATVGNASLAILIDEWSSLGDAEVQPLLAQLLRLTARGGICLKLACVPGRTKLFLPSAAGERRNPIGLELGDDITADVDLDSVVFVDNDIKQLTEFFIALLQRHIGASVPEVRDLTTEAFSTYILNERLKDPRILAELCHASSAVPRDFINIFRQATIAQRAAGADKMTAANVRSAAFNVYESKRSNLKSTRPDELTLLDRIYRKVVLGQHSYFFLIETSLVENPKIVELFTSKLIHKTSATWLDTASLVSYVYYMVDYGTSIELLRKAGARAWDDLTHGTMGRTSVDFFAPSANPSLLDLVLDKLVGSFAEARFDADPESLIVDLEMIES
jgi:Cdc6-like AAA superfamily ATPase